MNDKIHKSKVLLYKIIKYKTDKGGVTINSDKCIPCLVIEMKIQIVPKQNYMQVTRQAILRNTRSYKCLDTKSNWKWRGVLQCTVFLVKVYRLLPRFLRSFLPVCTVNRFSGPA